MDWRDEIVREWKELKAIQLQLLHLLKEGIVKTRTGNIDDTAQSVADCERRIAKFDELLEHHGPSS
jgi:hypothetical protein